MKNKNLLNLLASILPIIVIICIIITAFGLVYVVTIWTDRTLDFWLSYFKGYEINAPLWLSFICTVIGNGVTIIIDTISEIVMLLL